MSNYISKYSLTAVKQSGWTHPDNGDSITSSELTNADESIHSFSKDFENLLMPETMYKVTANYEDKYGQTGSTSATSITTKDDCPAPLGFKIAHFDNSAFDLSSNFLDLDSYATTNEDSPVTVPSLKKVIGSEQSIFNNTLLNKNRFLASDVIDYQDDNFFIPAKFIENNSEGWTVPTSSDITDNDTIGNIFAKEYSCFTNVISHKTSDSVPTLINFLNRNLVLGTVYNSVSYYIGSQSSSASGNAYLMTYGDSAGTKTISGKTTLESNPTLYPNNKLTPSQFTIPDSSALIHLNNIRNILTIGSSDYSISLYNTPLHYSGENTWNDVYSLTDPEQFTNLANFIGFAPKSLGDDDINVTFSINSYTTHYSDELPSNFDPYTSQTSYGNSLSNTEISSYALFPPKFYIATSNSDTWGAYDGDTHAYSVNSFEKISFGLGTAANFKLKVTTNIHRELLPLKRLYGFDETTILNKVNRDNAYDWTQSDISNIITDSTYYDSTQVESPIIIERLIGGKWYVISASTPKVLDSTGTATTTSPILTEYYNKQSPWYKADPTRLTLKFKQTESNDYTSNSFAAPNNSNLYKYAIEWPYTDASNTIFEIDNLIPGTAYQFRAIAANLSGTTIFPFTITTQAAENIEFNSTCDNTNGSQEGQIINCGVGESKTINAVISGTGGWTLSDPTNPITATGSASYSQTGQTTNMSYVFTPTQAGTYDLTITPTTCKLLNSSNSPQSITDSNNGTYHTWTFVVSANPSLTVNTNAATLNSTSSATLSGEVTANRTITDLGFIYSSDIDALDAYTDSSSTSTPTGTTGTSEVIVISKDPADLSSDNIITELLDSSDGLTAGSTWYYKAYGITSESGTKYGNKVTITLDEDVTATLSLTSSTRTSGTFSLIES